eukprot:4778431-Prymnesium_polylepis.1
MSLLSASRAQLLIRPDTARHSSAASGPRTRRARSWTACSSRGGGRRAARSCMTPMASRRGVTGTETERDSAMM